MESVVLSKRQLVQGLAAGYVVAFAGTGCTYSEELGRSQLLLVSPGQLSQMADSTWASVRKETPVSRNSKLNAQLQRVGPRVVNAAGQGRRNWEFTVLESDQENAFVLPNGKVGFYEGIMKTMANDDQVAAVMGHEVGHVTARHAAERYSQSTVAGLGLTVANVAIASSDSRHANEIAAVLGAGVTFGIMLPYSRRHELEADKLGIGYMRRANYDPREALRFWQSKANQPNRKKVPEFMSTHPSDATRIAQIRRLISQG